MPTWLKHHNTFVQRCKVIVWHRNESAGSMSEGRSGDDFRGEPKGDKVRVNDINEIVKRRFLRRLSLAVCSSILATN